MDNDCNPLSADGSAEASIGDACDDIDLDFCAEGLVACTSAALVCVDDGDQPDEVELCDGNDNDCNAATGDGSSESWIGDPCDDADADLCPEGMLDCVGGGMSCTNDDGDQPNEVELCDGSDNDCNPGTSDGAAVIGNACDGPDADLCTEGTITACSGGIASCDDASGDSTEACNGGDDDCNGTIDDVAGIGASCTWPGINTTGACVAEWRCVGSPGPGPDGLTCVQVVGPSVETCNGIDDDCNGTIDDGC
jgi:hypothetical protein